MGGDTKRALNLKKACDKEVVGPRTIMEHNCWSEDDNNGTQLGKNSSERRRDASTVVE